MNCRAPDHLESIDVDARIFPISWRDAAIGELYDPEVNGIKCPRCKKIFQGRAEYRSLQADHIFPFSRGGKTIWDNLQLLCKPCNVEKSSSIE